MKILVDTSVWSLALRRQTSMHPAVDELRHLIADGRVAMIGPIRQELLSGLREPSVIKRLRDHLRAFTDEPLDGVDYEQAAEHFNTCRRAGVQGSNTDFLLCAVAGRRGFPILTTDRDFSRHASLLPVRLHTFNA